MQALSQLSYGPALLRAGNHSDPNHLWEGVFEKICCSRDCGATGARRSACYLAFLRRADRISVIAVKCKAIEAARRWRVVIAAPSALLQVRAICVCAIAMVLRAISLAA
ncbi:hypothetical protein XcodCFBP4690_15325 [Xanthomonas codiaei]|uniref:Uncharacterized protein n=1 Tax=Xanthomonas codiaei TaxID=56463 RepID=A0A2S7CJN7_9XANT|nr:hypothetical protein XcodCFBP4690_15325 [Xanthomonas codiaei]